MEAEGFRFAPSSIRFSRKFGVGRQVIDFARSKWNADDDCGFWTMWAVESLEYKRWFQQQWGRAPDNHCLGGCSDWNIPGWPHTAVEHLRLTNSPEDVRVMRYLLDAFREFGIPYVNKLSTWAGAARAVLEDRRRFGWAADFFLLADEPKLAEEALHAGLREFGPAGRQDQGFELPGIRARLDRYFGG